MPGWDKAKEDQQYHRYRIRDPGLFKEGTLRTTDFDGKLSAGIKATRGKLKSNDSWATQSILFDKDKFDLEAAKKWYAAHKSQFAEMLEDAELDHMTLYDFDKARFEFAASYKCECIECGHKLTSAKHCADLKCPKCGGQMRRQERPGPGQGEHSDTPHDSEVDPTKTKINLKEVQVFCAGKYPQGEFTVKDLDEMIENFDPKQHEPPVTIDHRQDGPAMGWVKRIWRKGTFLYAELHECTKEFLDLLREGKFKKISVEIWRNYEDTGKIVLAAVSFLGSGKPQVKGMKSPVRHSIQDVHGARHFIASSDADTEEDIDMTTEELQALLKENNETILTKVTEKLTEFKAESADIKKKLDEKETLFAEKQKADQKVVFEKELSDLVQAGKMLPAWKDKIEKMEKQGIPIEQLSSMLEIFAKDMPKVVDVSELTQLKEQDKKYDGMTQTEIEVAKQLSLTPEEYKSGDEPITFGDIVHAAPKVQE